MITTRIWDWGLALHALAGFGAATLVFLLVRALHRFTVAGSTVAGLMLGLGFGLLALVQPMALIPVAVLVVIAAVAVRRYRPGEPGAALAATCLLVFPSVAAAGSSAFLAWRLG